MTETKTLRVWHIINPPNDPTYRRVSSIEEAVKKIKELAQKDLKDPRIEINAFGLEEYNDYIEKLNEWEEWYDEGGFDIGQIMDGESDYYNSEGIKINDEPFNTMPIDPGEPEKDDQRS